MENIKTVGILGFGETAQGIAHVVAGAGYDVMVWERDEASLDQGKAAFEASMDKRVGSGTLTQERKAEILDRITLTRNMDDLKGCDLVIESVLEEIETKKGLCADVSEVVAEKAILATNTSCLCVTQIAQAARQPDRVLGLHFLNPPETKKLVEVVKTEQTSQAVIETALGFCSKIGKETVVVKDSPGFIVNYLFVPYMNQALEAYDHGLASKEDLDKALEMGLGYPMGPLKLIDLMGLDEHLRITSVLYEQLADQRFAPPPILRKMAHGGKLGRRTNEGFYAYPDED